jgi:hypothetical protein
LGGPALTPKPAATADDAAVEQDETGKRRGRLSHDYQEITGPTCDTEA